MILRLFLWLGLTSFGGPAAHIDIFAYFLSSNTNGYPLRLFNPYWVCQMLPGPSSSQLGFALGVRWGGLAGGCLAYRFHATICDSDDSVGYGLMHIGANLEQLINALKLVTAAVVLHAVVGMARSFASGAVKSMLALAMMSVVPIIDMPFLHPLFIMIFGLIGMLVLRHEHHEDDLHKDKADPVADAYQSRLMPLIWLWGFAVIFAMWVFLAHLNRIASGCLEPVLYRWFTGIWWWSCCFTIIATSVVETELVTLADFLAGYGMA